VAGPVVGFVCALADFVVGADLTAAFFELVAFVIRVFAECDAPSLFSVVLTTRAKDTLEVVSQ